MQQRVRKNWEQPVNSLKDNETLKAVFERLVKSKLNEISEDNKRWFWVKPKSYLSPEWLNETYCIRIFKDSISGECFAQLPVIALSLYEFAKIGGGGGMGLLAEYGFQKDVRAKSKRWVRPHFTLMEDVEPDWKHPLGKLMWVWQVVHEEEIAPILPAGI